MGHSHHFLSRLDRVSLPQVELALSLYRDADLLRYVLERARLPEGAGRVAIALEESERSPHIIVTREGRFVTCLGEGMAVDDVPILTRSRLDAIAARGTDLRARLEACKTRTGGRGGAGQLLKRVHEAGDELSREEIVDVSALQPLYALEMMKFVLAAHEDLLVSREVLLRHLRRSERLKPALHSAARAYWNAFWSLGHFSVLAATDGKNVLQHIPAGGPATSTTAASTLSWCCVRQGIGAIALKGAWAAGRIGKVLLPEYKRLFRDAGSLLTTVNACLGLLAIGARHSGTRAEIRKLMAAGPDIDEETKRGAGVHRIAELAAAVGEACDVEELRPELFDEQRIMGATACVAVTRHLPRGSPFAFAAVDDVPADLAMAMAVNIPLPFIGHDAISDVLITMFGLMPWAARSAPEALYLPRDFIRATAKPWTPEATCRLVNAHRTSTAATSGPRPGAPAAPVRQGPCPCGSGKKFKRCCESVAG